MYDVYCSEKNSELLKNKGFNEPCIKFWNKEYYEYSLYVSIESPVSNTELKTQGYNGFTAPTHQCARAWLRDKKGIFFCIHPDYPTSKKYIVEFYDDGTPSGVFGNYEKYEDAVEAGLTYSLEHLI